ncbi:uncharacterized protein [Macrobrachium rosenbergii]|uniref:uncharacterized protein n=1 Tax=Macrobrachium rosenbergii TaxID=79674 RepID=UPI0034D59CA7
MAEISLILLMAGIGFLMYDAGGASSNSKIYYRTTVTSDILRSCPVSEVVHASSLIGCAQQANARSWCHLMCYDGQVCSLYDVMIPKSHNITNATVGNCWTDTEVLPPCPPGFVSAVGAGCLYINTTQVIMATADSFCTSIKSRLVIPQNVAGLTAFARTLTPLDPYY